MSEEIKEENDKKIIIETVNKRIDIKESNMSKINILAALYEKEISENVENANDKDKIAFIVNLAIEKLHKSDDVIKRFQEL